MKEDKLIGKTERLMKEAYNEGWNAALEAAAKAAEKYESYGAAYEIRTLKK